VGYNKWEHRKNEDILDKLKITLSEEMEYVNRISTGRILKEILRYHPGGQR
jgi:hypothetical protein